MIQTILKKLHLYGSELSGSNVFLKQKTSSRYYPMGSSTLWIKYLLSYTINSLPFSGDICICQPTKAIKSASQTLMYGLECAVLEILLKCRFQFISAKVGAEILHL